MAKHFLRRIYFIGRYTSSKKRKMEKAQQQEFTEKKNQHTHKRQKRQNDKIIKNKIKETIPDQKGQKGK